MVLEKILQARSASFRLRALDNNIRNQLLLDIVEALHLHGKDIIQANQKDTASAQESNLSIPLLQRLRFDDNKIDEVSTILLSVIEQPNYVYKDISTKEIASHLILKKRYVPLGVIGMIFESRPDALIQMAALCLKTANCVVLKGGKEAQETNRVLHQIIVDATKHIIKDWIQLLETRTEVDELIRAERSSSVDLIIPRGSNEFVSYIMNHANVPVLGHADGICHVYIHPKANLIIGRDILYDAKLQYPAVCNSVECLLIDDQALIFLPQLLHPLVSAGVTFYADSDASEILTSAQIPHTPADESSWGKEYSDTVLSIKTVDNVEEAISHINQYGSGHTDVIVTQDEQIARQFQDLVDAASVCWNCSSRFADGYRYGLGAEVGISTSKIHARGPVGLEGLMSTQWVLDGQGHIVKPFVDGTQKFTHIDISMQERQ